MSLRHACFISYRGILSDSYQSMVERFYHALKDELTVIMELEEPVYLDVQRLQGNGLPDPASGRALCESACMIVLYTPRYFKSKHCALEYRAMQELEQSRCQLSQRSRNEKRLIVPLVLRGSKTLPDEIRLNQQCFFMDKLSTNEIDTSIVMQLAEYINERYEDLVVLPTELSSNCKNFQLPSLHEQEVKSWLEGLYHDKSVRPPFPGIISDLS